jgi:magnesium-protoporphyrin IX monomethyl ester (oxidative) cyclase
MEMRKVFLLVPPIEVCRDEGNVLPPLGALYLSSALKKGGFEVKILDWRVEKLGVPEVIDMIKEEKPIMVGVSIMTPHVPLVIEFSEELKKECPDVKICLGGPHINGTREEIFRFSKSIDFLIYGEGEETIVELARSLPKGDVRRVKGLVYRDGKRIVVNPPKPFIENIDSLAFPDLGDVDLGNYSIFSGSKKRVASIITSRGCPFNCAFCDVHTTMGRRLRLRSVKNVVDEIEGMVERFGVEEIFIKDSTFTIRRAWVHDFCRELKRRGLGIGWICNTRVDCVDEPLLRAMKKAGCKQIAYGVESGSEEILRNINKGITLDKVKKVFTITKRVGIDIQGFFMIGNPGETPETVRKTIDFAKKLSPDFANFAPTIAYPNTEIYSWGLRTKTLKDRYWYMKKTSQYIHLFFSEGQLDLPELSPDEQVRWVKKAYMQYYFRPKFIFQTLIRVSSTAELKKVMNAAWRIISSSVR